MSQGRGSQRHDGPFGLQSIDYIGMDVECRRGKHDMHLPENYGRGRGKSASLINMIASDHSTGKRFIERCKAVSV